MQAKSRLFIALAIAVATPYLARLPGMMTHGSEWLTSYFPSVLGVLFFNAFALLAGVGLFFFSTMHPRARSAFLAGSIVLFLALFAMHSTLDLSSDSTAAVALVIFPFLALVPTAASFFGVVLAAKIRGRKD